MNWYNYVGGDPVNRVDPDGKEALDRWEEFDRKNAMFREHDRLREPQRQNYTFAASNPFERGFDVRNTCGGPELQQRDWCGSDGTERVPDSWWLPTDGGGFVRINLAPACMRHDGCYGLQSCSSRRACDVQFRKDIYNRCTSQGGQSGACNRLARAYYLGVRIGGANAYQGQHPDPNFAPQIPRGPKY